MRRMNSPRQSCLLWVLLVLLVAEQSHGFSLSAASIRQRQQQPWLVLLFSARDNSITAREEERTKDALIRAALQLQPGVKLGQVHLVGVTDLPSSSTRSSLFARTNRTTCAVLATTPLSQILLPRRDTTSATMIDEQPQPCLLLPLSNPTNQLTLLQAAFIRRSSSVSKILLLSWDLLAVNRDGALFDNLPYTTWTIDPYRTDHRDAAGNPVLERFHFGKRDAYNRLLGKDWVFSVTTTSRPSDDKTAGTGTTEWNNNAMGGASAAPLSNLLTRLQDALLPSTNVNTDNKGTTSGDDGTSAASSLTNRDGLEQRILELQIRELEMDLAEWDYQLAVARNNHPERASELEAGRQGTVNDLKATKERIQRQQQQKEPIWDATSFLTKASFFSTAANKNRNPAPYPGATGYPPMPADNQTTATGTPVVYTNPYDMFREILRQQMKAEVIGAVLENSSLLEGTLTLGGALVLRRIQATKQVNLLGESLQIQDQDETFGNDGITGGTTVVVECDADEAVGMSLACGVPLQVERLIWERGCVIAAIKPDQKTMLPNESLPGALPAWQVTDPELSVLTEGEAGNQSLTERASPIRFPRTSTNLFDEISRQPPRGASSEMFPTDNPIQSLQFYDDLDNEGKARVLMGMSSFDGRLPRPRVLMGAAKGEANALDKLLLPLIDETVRNQYLLRDAEYRGDWDRVAELKESKSRRQVAKEKAEEAKMAGSDDVADWWEKEAEFLATLRADPTQDEGSYSRFLDRDEWYERTRRNQANKLDRKKFGTLLDGIE